MKSYNKMRRMLEYSHTQKVYLCILQLQPFTRRLLSTSWVCVYVYSGIATELSQSTSQGIGCCTDVTSF